MLENKVLSLATKRFCDKWNCQYGNENEFSTDFKYSKITGIGYEEGVTRRDASKVIKINGTYYVWYTCRRTGCAPVGIEKADDKKPAQDWDLADIWFATSKDGYNWTEQGCAISRSPKGSFGDRTVCTPDILVDNGKYYLFYQVYTGKFAYYSEEQLTKLIKNGDKREIKNLQTDNCDVTMAWSNSPDGPWNKTGKPVIKRGNNDEWDGGCIHDPYPLKYNGKYMVYYKATPVKKHNGVMSRAQGVAISDNPFGPYRKSELNPIMNSGHETFLYPYKEGIVAVATFDGPEKNTIQYAKDGFNFEVKSIIEMAPMAAGPFCSDAFADNKDGRGITWGLCHMKKQPFENDLYLARFECNLSRDIDRIKYTHKCGRLIDSSYFEPSFSLNNYAKSKIIEENKLLDKNTIM